MGRKVLVLLLLTVKQMCHQCGGESNSQPIACSTADIESKEVIASYTPADRITPVDISMNTPSSDC